MPWKERVEMDERVKFAILAREIGANISELCRKFNISRKTGYKLIQRYEDEGLAGVAPRSRRPKYSPCALSGEIVCKIVELRARHPRWGGRKLHTLLERETPPDDLPSVRSVERILERCDLTITRRKRRFRHIPTVNEVIQPEAPNHVWTIDFKGDWRMRNGARVYPLTVRDDYSKFILDIAALSGTRSEATKERLIHCFNRFGLPKYIRSDNGTPFACMRAIAGLSQLSAWWIKNGVIPNRIPPASPQCNPGHERMHLDMMRELELKPARNLGDEQLRFDQWKEEYNSLRPHESLKMKTPDKCYQKSRKKYDHCQEDFVYPREFELRKVCNRGTIKWHGRVIFISHALKHETIAFKRENEDLMSVWFCNFLLGSTDKNFRSPLGGNALL